MKPNDHTHESCCSHKTTQGSKNSKPEVTNEQTSPNYVRNVFRVGGMDCADEISAIEIALKDPKIQNVTCSLMSSTVTVDHHKDITRENIEGMIEKAAVKVLNDSESKKNLHVESSRIYLVGTSGIALGIGMILDWIKFEPEGIAQGLFILSIICGGILIFPKAWRSIQKFHLDMNVLMTVAVSGAFIIGQHSEAAAVVFLFSLSEL